MAEAADAHLLHPDDTVATLTRAVAAGGQVRLLGGPDGAALLPAREAIAAGHKLAVVPIAAGAPVIKYGSPIGRAGAAIAAGAHVHTHNLISRLAPAAQQPAAPAAQQPAAPAAQPPAAPAAPQGEPAPAARIAPDRLHALVAAAMRAAGAHDAAAEDFAAHCVEAEACGVRTHGLRRLAPYLQRLRIGGVDGAASPTVTGDRALLGVNGNNGVGHHTARVAADAVVARARVHGIAAALVRDSNHLGFAGHYAAHIARQGMVGMVVSNGQVMVGPPDARGAILSNNPLALAAPVADGPPFQFDMATSVTSRANIVAAAEQGRPIAAGMALDADGLPTTDAAAALAGILLPMGGARGFGLILALEVLAGVLPGGAFADQVASKEAAPDRPEGTGHFLLAIDPAACGGTETLAARMADLGRRVAALPMREGASPARLPGARRAALRAEAMRTGIALDAAALAGLHEVAAPLGLSVDLLPEGTA